MKTGYQIYKRRKGENAFISAGLFNWFALEEEAVAKCEKLNQTWEEYEYIVVSLYD